MRKVQTGDKKRGQHRGAGPSHNRRTLHNCTAVNAALQSVVRRRPPGYQNIEMLFVERYTRRLISGNCHAQEETDTGRKKSQKNRMSHCCTYENIINQHTYTTYADLRCSRGESAGPPPPNIPYPGLTYLVLRICLPVACVAASVYIIKDRA